MESKCNFLFSFNILSAIGISIPRSEKDGIARERLKYREIYVSLYNQANEEFITNTCRIPAQLNENYEDRWKFTD